MKPPPIRPKIIEVLKSANKSLTAIQIITKTGFTKSQVRNVISSKYDSPIVYIGNGYYDLVGRALQKLSFRYSPTEQEIKKGILYAEDDLADYLLWRNYEAEVVLLDRGIKYRLKRIRSSRRTIPSYFKGFAGFFRKYKIEFKDNILFTPINYEKHVFQVKYVPMKKQPRGKILKSNKFLRDAVYDILNHLPQKQEVAIFLSPRLLPLMIGLKEPPDNMLIALANDERFLAWENIGYKTIALKKFTVVSNHDGLGIRRKYSPVYIESDEYGSYGGCYDCGIPLKWFPISGWVHPDENAYSYKLYRDEVELDKSFFKQQ